MTSPRSTIYLKFILFQFFFNRSSIPDPRSPILDTSFPVNLEVLLIKIFHILTTTKIYQLNTSNIVNLFNRRVPVIATIF